MKLLYYNELDYSKVKEQFKKVTDNLSSNNFKSVDIKKMSPTNYYRAKLDKTNRLLFKFAEFDNIKYILLLEIIYNHQYDKSKFLKGAPIDENKFEIVNSIDKIDDDKFEKLIYLNNKKNYFFLLDKIISFDEIQEDIYTLPTPLTIIGSAGSGKTMLTLEKLKKLKGQIAYISLSSFLVESAEKIYYSNNYENEHQEIDFLTFNEYLKSIRIPKGSEIQFTMFENWYNKYKQHTKIADTYKLFEEFKGVLTGSNVDVKYLSKEEYINLGIKQSIFTAKEREVVYSIFIKYLNFLDENNFYETNIISFEYLSFVVQKYDFIVIDEVQDITNIQLKLILKSLKNENNFLLTGDSNQIVHPNFFSWSKVKTLFFKSNFNFSLVRILSTNYRNSQNVTEKSNLLLKIKNARFGSIDKESTYLIKSVTQRVGDVILLKETDKIKNELNTKTKNSVKFAVLVMNNKDKENAKKYFKTPLIFSIQEAKGLEYENIIMINFVSSNKEEFDNIIKGVNKDDLKDEIKFNRAKNKEDKDLEVYKFFINSLYVAFTRSISNIYIIEQNDSHELFKLLELKEIDNQIKLDVHKSNDFEWLEEARKLELQGKYEQARQIRDKIAGVDFISDDDYQKLKEVALDPKKSEQEVKRERKDLFKYAEARKKFDDIQQLADLNFLRAVVFIKELKQTKKNYEKSCRLSRINEIIPIINKYGVDFELNNEKETGVFYAVKFGQEELLNFFIKNNANITIVNLDNFNLLQVALRNVYNNILNKNKQFADITFLEKFYLKLKQNNIKYVINDMFYKINSVSMEYFLLNIFKAIQDIIISSKIKKLNAEKISIKKILDYEAYDRYLNLIKNNENETGIKVDDIITFVENFSGSFLPDYRKKRSYISSILAKNEKDKESIYNKKIFIRVSRGTYILNPEIQFNTNYS